MAVIVMVMGQSGTGKSASLRNFKPGEVSVINVSGKPLPFRNKLAMVSTNQYAAVEHFLKEAKAPSIVIDDATYLLIDEFMRRAGEAGYQKFTDMARNFSRLIETARTLPDDRIVYFLGHTAIADDGREHFKTIGKMLDEKLVVEGKFIIVLKTVVEDGRYYFTTQNNGADTVKSPMGMFDATRIDNDLAAVDRTIRDYYDMKKTEDATV